MKEQNPKILFRRSLFVAASLLLTQVLAPSATTNNRSFTSNEHAKVQGIIMSRDGQILRLRTDDDSIGIIDLSDETRIQLKHGMFGRKAAMSASSLVAGLRVEAEGTGNDKGELLASRILFDPGSMKASRQIDTRVAPLEGRTGSLEGRAGSLETRAGQMEAKQGDLENQQKQTQQQVGQVKASADQANQGVGSVNDRVTNLDNYRETDRATVYFKLNSTALSAASKKQLDDLAQKALAQRGYAIEVAGFADKTGKADRNQKLSEQRAAAVTRYLEQQGNVPIPRILTPTGMGTSHEAAGNNTSEGRKMNRRVEVRVLINQGLVAGAAQPAKAGETSPQ